MEFTGEDTIDHTPRDEMVRVNTGNSFDLVGERKRTDYKMNSREKTIDESFEIKARNHKKTPVEIRVVEHLYRWNNWNIIAKSDECIKTDAQTVERFQRRQASRLDEFDVHMPVLAVPLQILWSVVKHVLVSQFYTYFSGYVR